MIGKLELGLVAALAVGGVGCVSCRYRAREEMVRPAEPGSVPVFARQQVYLFMMNGYDVLELSGMLGLRDQVCQAGYPKVYYAQREDVRWFVREMRRVARDEPGCRIILLGYGSAADRVQHLATDAVRDQLPLDAVVFLDPVGLNGDLAGTLPAHTVVIRSHNWRGGRGLIARETVTLPQTGHFSSPNHPATVDTVVRLMTASATLVPIDDSAERLPHLTLRNEPPPTPRSLPPVVWNGPRDEWDFLKPVHPFPVPPIH